MAEMIERLRKRVGSSAADDALLTEALADATTMVDDYIADSGYEADDVTEALAQRAVLRCAVALFNQDKAPNGIFNQPFDMGGGETATTPVRVSYDPMVSARAILAGVIPQVAIG